MKFRSTLSTLIFTAVFPAFAPAVHAQERSPARKPSAPAPASRTAEPRVATPMPIAPAIPVAPSSPAPAGFDLSAETAPTEFASRFFALLQKGEVDAAYDGLTKGSKIANKPDEVKALKAKTKEAIEVFGTVLGFQAGESKLVGERLLRRTYISLGREFPLRWRFYFYKPDQNWRLVDLRVDDRLGGIFEEPEESHSADIKP